MLKDVSKCEGGVWEGGWRRAAMFGAPHTSPMVLSSLFIWRGINPGHFISVVRCLSSGGCSSGRSPPTQHHRPATTRIYYYD